MLDAADILVDRQPMIGRRPIGRGRRIGRIGEAHEIPGRIDERIHRVRLARRRPAALRAGDVLPCRMAVKRIAGLIERHVVGQLDRQVFGRDRHDAANLAMDDRNRATPIALAGNAPVSELVVDLPLGLRPVAEHRLLQPARNFLLGLLDRHAIEKARIDHHAVAVVGDLVDGEGRGVGARRRDHRRRAKAIGVDEIKIPLIVGRAAENRARAVFHQHEIGDIDRQAPVGVERVNHFEARVIAPLLRGLDRSDRRPNPAAFLDERCEGRIAPRRRARQRMVGRDRHELRAEQRVGTGRIDFELGRLRFAGERAERLGIDDEANQQALRAPNPVALHETDFFRPAVETVEARQEIVRIFGDPEEPLRELALLDDRPRAPAAPVDHLLVGENRLIDRVPVDLRLLARDKPGRRGNPGTASADAYSSSDRRSRSHATSRATGPSTATGRAWFRCWRRSISPDGCCFARRRFRPAGRKRPTPSDGAR